MGKNLHSFLKVMSIIWSTMQAFAALVETHIVYFFMLSLVSLDTCSISLHRYARIFIEYDVNGEWVGNDPIKETKIGMSSSWISSQQSLLGGVIELLKVLLTRGKQVTSSCPLWSVIQWRCSVVTTKSLFCRSSHSHSNIYTSVIQSAALRHLKIIEN